MTKDAKDAMKLINEKLKTMTIDDDYIEGHRIDQRKDFKKINTKIVFNERCTNKLLSFIDLVLNTDYTYTGGVLTIPNVTGNLVIDGEEPELQDFTIKYVYGNNITFDGSSWINTDVKLFSQENFDRDFELTVDVVSCTYDSHQN